MKVWPKPLIATHAVMASLVAVAGVALAVASTMWWWAVAGSAAAGLWFWLATRRFWKRRKVTSQPFPEPWRETLAKTPLYRRLGPKGRARFENDVQIFLAEQRIYGARGVEIDDATRLYVAASAATLGHGLPNFEWPRVRDIVIHPASFDDDYKSGHSASDSGPRASGMVHHQGPILFSSPDLRFGFRRADGHNVGLHEMAHVLDLADGYADGVPVGFAAEAHWVEVVTDRLRQLRKRRYRGILDRYGGTNEAELFAVAVETFFERPEKLSKTDPELFDMLREYFGLDPADP